MRRHKFYGILSIQFVINLLSFLSAQSHCLKNESCLEANTVTLINISSETLSQKYGLTTGLEFLQRNGFQLLDKDWLNSETKPFSGTTSVLKLVQGFIRNLKGLPSDISELAEANRTERNETAVEKPDWCFDPYKLKDLVVDELTIYKMLKNISTQNRVTSLALESYFADFEDSTLQTISYFEYTNSSEDKYLYIASHPFLVYRMIRRFAEDLHIIFMQFGVNSSEFPTEMKYRDTQTFPNSTDLLDALESIYRIQHINLQNTFTMGKGILGNVDTGIRLTALSMLELGAFYLEKKHYDYSIEWLYSALELVKQCSEAKQYPNIVKIFDSVLEQAINEHNTNFSRKLYDRKNPRMFTERVISPFNPNSYNKTIDIWSDLATEQQKNTTYNWAMSLNFRRLCAGEKLQTEQEIAKLYCWLEKSKNQYWIINPLKMELLNLEPPVHQIYDFIGNKLIEKMKNSASTQLYRSRVADDKKPNATVVSKSRTSSQVWFYEHNENYEYLIPLSKQLELLSGLNIVPPLSSDSYQVALYGPSHHYNMHLDSFILPNQKTELKGNRITTIMGYLSNVDIGGRTAFPVLGIAVEPVKGSVLMWNNLKRNGEERDERMYHGGCPVVMGVKWSERLIMRQNAFTSIINHFTMVVFLHVENSV